MKKIVIDHYSHTFRPLRLYREDLDRVLEILSGRCNEINISDESHVYDSLEEMKSSQGPKVPLLKIDARNPHVSLSLGINRLTRLVARIPIAFSCPMSTKKASTYS